MQIQIYEPATGDFLTREDVRRMRLPFRYGWDTWLVTSATGRILGRHKTYLGAYLQFTTLRGPTALAA